VLQHRLELRSVTDVIHKLLRSGVDKELGKNAGTGKGGKQ
jgi:hypothetical protein